MIKTVTVTWASEEDKIAGKDFIKARRTKLEEMTTANKTNGVVTHVSEPSASIVFVDQTAADEWVTFVQSLATTYNKNITSIEIQ